MQRFLLVLWSKLKPLCLVLCSYLLFLISFSEITPEGRRITKLDQILLNGNNITMVSHQGLHVLIICAYKSIGDGLQSNSFKLNFCDSSVISGNFE